MFAYDVQFYIDFIVNKEKWISSEDFNNKLKNLKLNARDSNNRPKPFKKGAKKYEGNAGSLRILSRYVTLVLAPYLQESLVEKCLILLHEFSEIITAPKLSLYNIEVTMNRIVKSYLDARIKATMRD